MLVQAADLSYPGGNEVFNNVTFDIGKASSPHRAHR